MEKSEQIKIVKISYIVGIIVSFFISFIKSRVIDTYGIISAIKVSVILTLWWTFYFEVGWKLPLLNKILYRINLNGTWYGQYKSTSVSDRKVYKGAMVIRIKQNFLKINVTSFTNKYNNYSYSENLKYDKDAERYSLIYVYSQSEKNASDLAQRNGTSNLMVVDGKDKCKLEGGFWTIVGSNGRLELTRVSREIANSFEDGKELYKQFKEKGR